MLQDDVIANEKLRIDLLQTVHSSACLMHQLIDDLLELIKIDFGRLPVDVDKRPANVARVIWNSIMMNKLYAARKEMKLEFFVR
jgi:hypothetical protein